MGDTLRILSANLWNGAAEPDALARLVVESAADVVAVQELAPDQAEVLSAVMPNGVLAPRTDYKGMGLVSRVPGRFETVPLPYRSGFALHIEPDDCPGLLKPLEILNLHIAAPHVRPYGVGPIHRRRQWLALSRYLDAQRRDSRVLVGDFNSTPAWPLYRRLTPRFQDAAVEVARRQGRRPERTWGPTPSAPRLLRIDHGFVQGTQVEDFRVIPVAGSDHCGVLVEVALG
jgi:endonuclease/exonuclease/phosphatase (EEP) superfamily protein YafD